MPPSVGPNLGRWPVDAVIAAWQRARAAGLPVEPAALFVDLDRLDARFDALRAAFPSGTLHAPAIKAQPALAILRHLVARGAGLEAASWEEVQLALAAGCAPDRVLFDSPAKTRAELHAAAEAGIRLNVDSLEELARVTPLAPAHVLVRVDPNVGAGRIEALSTSVLPGRFGVPLGELPELPSFVEGLHVHVGSQGMALERQAEGVARVETVRKRLGLPVLDVGGGLSVPFRAGDPAPTVSEWAAALFAAAPSLREAALITEIGRWLHAPTGAVVTRVEYTRDTPAGRLGVMHVGADLMLRAVYRPEDWWHEVEIRGPDGDPVHRPLVSTILAGPLCFGGDLVVRDRRLPRVEEGDLVVICDTGAYTLGMWSRHCSRSVPALIGAANGETELLRSRETAEDLVRFWGG